MTDVAETSGPLLAPANYVTIALAERLTRLSAVEMRERMRSGAWKRGVHFFEPSRGIVLVAWRRAGTKPLPELQENMDQVLAGLVRQARKRAKLASREFDLTREFVRGLFAAQNGRCAVSGTPFDLAKPEGATKRPFAPSLDRIASAGGYTEGNVRLVCCAVNFMMNEWGDSVYRRLVKEA